ncbi:TPA: restriction endonuclease subunit S [Clostridium perfringens]|uniref:restriction endonuclease subunit S n=1 Tax=Clostridium perfringens TaxID=1502 RepID=UPI002971F758|nr:restriction endonuclease subunit S [Clostridium perfringens]
MKKEAREGYKMTELGEIPNEWQIKNLEDISYLIDGDRSSRYPGEKDIVEHGILFLNTQNIIDSKIVYKNCKFITEEKFDELSKGKLQKNDLIITLRGSIGNVAKFNGDIYETGFINAQIMIIRSNDINPTYLSKYLISVKSQKQITSISSGSAQPQLTKSELKKLKVIVPSEYEQKKIVEILSTVDEQIENTEKLIQKNQELKKGLMQQLLTKGIGHTEFKKTELGEIPKAWEIKKIEEICEILDSKRVPLNGKQRLKMQGDIPYYGANAIVDYINDYIFDDELILIAEDGGNFGEFREKPIAFYVKGKCWVNNHAHVLKAIECENSKWIFYNLVHKDITEIVQGGTRAKLNQKDLRNIKIPFPNLDEQEKIALILSSIDKKIEQYKYKKEKLEELKKGLMKQLLNGNIRVI